LERTVDVRALKRNEDGEFEKAFDLTYIPGRTGETYLFKDAPLGTILTHMKYGFQIATVWETAEATLMQAGDSRTFEKFDFARNTLTSGLVTVWAYGLSYLGKPNRKFWKGYREWGDISNGIPLSPAGYQEVRDRYRRENIIDSAGSFIDDAIPISLGIKRIPLTWRSLADDKISDEYRKLVMSLNDPVNITHRYGGFSCIPIVGGHDPHVFTIAADSRKITAFPLALRAKGDKAGLNCLKLEKGLDTVIEQAVLYRSVK
jgi:hypothetical protein